MQWGALASWWATPGNPGTIPVKAAPEGRGCLSGPRKDSQCPERRAGEGLYLQRIAFQKDCLWLAVKLIYLLCPHMRKITHPPSEVCMHVCINVYLSSEFMCHIYHQTCQRLLYIQLLPIPPRSSSVPSVLSERNGSSPSCPPPEWVMTKGEQASRSSLGEPQREMLLQ